MVLPVNVVYFYAKAYFAPSSTERPSHAVSTVRTIVDMKDTVKKIAQG